MERGNTGLAGFFRCTTTRRMAGVGNGLSKKHVPPHFPYTYSIFSGMLVVFIIRSSLPVTTNFLDACRRMKEDD